MSTNHNLPNTNPNASARVADAAAGLGALVWWSLTNTRVSPDRLRIILAEEGADPSIVPDIDQAPAVKRAVRAWSVGRGKADRYRAEVAGEDANGNITIGVLKREQVSADEVRWNQIDRLVFDAKAAAWALVGSTVQATEFRAAADEVRFYLDHDFIRPEVIQRALGAMQAITLRDRGGVYFVAATYAEDLDRLARIVARIGACHLDIVHAQGTPSSVASIGRGVEASLLADLGEVKDRISGWLESARNVSSTSSASVLTSLSEIQGRATLYADALGYTLDDLRDSITACHDEALRIIAGRSATAKPEGAPAEVRDDVVAKVRTLVAGATWDAKGEAWIPGAEVRAGGLSADFYFWKAEGVGGAAARSIGIATAKRWIKPHDKGVGILHLVRIETPPGVDEVAPTAEAAPEAVEVETAPEVPEATPVAEAEAEVVSVEVDADADAVGASVVPDEDAIANVREQLAERTVGALRVTYQEVIGTEAPRAARKADLVLAIAERLGA